MNTFQWNPIVSASRQYLDQMKESSRKNLLHYLDEKYVLEAKLKEVEEKLIHFQQTLDLVKNCEEEAKKGKILNERIK